MHTQFWLQSLKERDDLKDLGLRGRIILSHLRDQGFGDLDWIHLAQIGTGSGSSEHENERSGSIKCWEFGD
jgi:hypothetical protein